MATVIKRGRNKWLVRVFKGRDASGRRIFVNRTVTGTKEDAKNWAYEEKRRETAANPTIGELLDDLILDYRVNGKSLAWAEIVCNVHLRPVFGGIKAARMATQLAEQYMLTRQKAGRKNSTINRELALLRRAFNLAKRSTPPKVAFVPFIPTLEENNVRKGFFEDGEYHALLAELPEAFRPILAFGYYTGCRRGEILGLRWSQVNLVDRKVQLAAGETKSGEARTIPLVTELYQMLAIQKALRDQEHASCPWVFFDAAGAQITGRALRSAWLAASLKAGLWEGDPENGKPSKLFHDLRRSAVRNLVRAGTPETVAQRISGHKTRAVFDRYNITSEDDLTEAAARLERYHENRRTPARSHTIVTQAPSKPS